ncbi:O-antigen polysaccharide polymerase Wzy [Bacteroides luti]|nr:O-antigen polysaccharide polymerase Wzy [Bacteroides luti]
MIFTLIIALPVLYSNSVNIVSFVDLRIMGGIGVFILSFCFKSWNDLKQKLFSPYIVFLVTLSIFSFGQSFLYTINYISEERDLIGYAGITINDIFYAQSYTLVMITCFHIGALMSIKKSNYNTKKSLNVDYSLAIKKIGIILFIISIIPFLYSLINDMIVSLTRGYGALYEIEERVGLDNIFLIVANYFIPSYICLYVGFRKNVKVLRMLNIFAVVIIIVIFITGGRTNGVILIATAILIYNFIIKPLTKKQYVIILVLGIFLLSILSVISNTRSNSGRGIDSYTNNIEKGQNSALNTICEMGGSMFCLIKTKDYVPNTEDYRYGKSYLFSFTTLIPNINFWKIHPAVKESDLNAWLTKKVDMGYGTGFSMVAESYINFGWFGSIVMLLMGYVFASFMNVSKIRNNDYAKFVFCMIIFWFTISTVRNSFISVVRGVCFFAWPIYAYIIYYTKHHKTYGLNIRNRR